MTRTSTIAVSAAVFVGLASAVAVPAYAGGGFRHHTPIERTVSSPVRQVVVVADAADVTATTRPAATVTLRASSSWWSPAPRLETSLENGVLTIRPDCKRGLLCDMRLRLTLPAGIPARITTDAGDISLTGSPGRIAAVTDAGDVDLDLSRVSVSVSARTDAGDVSIRVPRGRYAVEADTDAGDVTVRSIVQDPAAPTAIVARTDAGDVTITGA